MPSRVSEAAKHSTRRRSAPKGKDSDRFHCPYPGCERSCAELWRLKVHYRAPSNIRGSGVERGHDAELEFCPKCNEKLEVGKHHFGCRSGLTAPRQAVHRSKDRKKKGGTKKRGGSRRKAQARKNAEERAARRALDQSPGDSPQCSSEDSQKALSVACSTVSNVTWDSYPGVYKVDAQCSGSSSPSTGLLSSPSNVTSDLETISAVDFDSDIDALLYEGSWTGGKAAFEEDILLPNLLPNDFSPVLELDCADTLIPAAVTPEPLAWAEAFMMTDIATHEARILQMLSGACCLQATS